MIENQIKQFITKYNNVSYLDKEDSGEGVLYGISLGFIDTALFNEEQYGKWEKLLDSIDVIKPNYQLYCSWDRSGFKFWNDRRSESNYTYIDIWISDDFSDDDITALFTDVDKVIKKISNSLFNLK